jgi:hypothetical protein
MVIQADPMSSFVKLLGSASRNASLILSSSPK